MVLDAAQPKRTNEEGSSRKHDRRIEDAARNGEVSASARTLITRSPGQVETLSMPFRYYPVGADALPPYVQSAGYAGFFLLVAFLLFAVARILLLLRRQLQLEGESVGT